MTDRFKGLTVVFEKEIREDDAEGIINAIRQLRGVADVTPSLMTSEDYYAVTRAKMELTKQLWEVLHPKDE